MTHRPISYSEVLTNSKSGGQFIRKWKALKNRLNYLTTFFKWQIHLVKHSKKLDYGKIIEGSIPILLNNFNRLESLKQLISWLCSLDTPVSIIILDNKSTYPPLLEYYDSLKESFIQVIKMDYNSGLFGLSYYFKKLDKYDKIVISDCDLVPYMDTPKDTLTKLSALLDDFPAYNHVGLSLGIDDLPDSYPLKSLVLAWEERFWPPFAKEVGAMAYEAEVDTTFGMFRNTSIISPFKAALRTKPPYTLKHLDWYIDPQFKDREYDYYMSRCSPFGSWTREWIRWKTGGKGSESLSNKKNQNHYETTGAMINDRFGEK